MQWQEFKRSVPSAEAQINIGEVFPSPSPRIHAEKTHVMASANTRA
jgi:hypothetical protein